MKNLTFKADERYKQRLDNLQQELDLDRSKVIRLAIDSLYNMVLQPEKKPGDLVLVSGFDYRMIIQGKERMLKLAKHYNELAEHLIKSHTHLMEGVTAAITPMPELIGSHDKNMKDLFDALRKEGGESNKRKK